MRPSRPLIVRDQTMHQQAAHARHHQSSHITHDGCAMLKELERHTHRITDSQREHRIAQTTHAGASVGL